ncbi:MAG: hypothetical protein NDJ90_01225 [Oligoflexia bacterium]|nr:hypothetical protein [Oligoflexia bacterium]
MNKLMVTLGILLIASSASAAKLEFSDLVGRTLLTDQTSAATQGILEISASRDFEFTGKINGNELNCTGKVEFDSDNQTLFSAPTCNGNILSAFRLDLSRVEIGPFLEGGLVTMRLTYAQRQSMRHGLRTYFFKEIDGKKLD